MSECKKLHLGPFTGSICPFDSWRNQLIHFGIHLGIALAVDLILFLGFVIEGNAGPWVGAFTAFSIEVWDGFKKYNKEGRPAEGFNVYPDLVFRCSGAFVGGFFV